MPPITVCVINWNGVGVVESCLAAILTAVRPGDEVILVDDASNDCGPALIAIEFPSVRILRQARTSGPAAARNRGYREAAHDHIVFVDQDVVPISGCLTAISAALCGPLGPTLVMARMLYARMPSLIQFDGAEAHFTGLMTVQNRDRPAGEVAPAAREIGSIITSCFAVNRSRWGCGPLFDETFYFYLEDHDLGIRARQRGHRIVAEPAAACLHGDGTPGVSFRATGEFTETRVVNTIRNRWQVILKRFELRTILLLAPSLVAFELAQLIGAMRKGWLGRWITAARWIATERHAILAERRRSQKRDVVGMGLC